MGAQTDTEARSGHRGTLRGDSERPLPWSVARQIALTRAEWACEICHRPDWEIQIEVHHVVPVEDYRPGPQHAPEGLLVLCQPHHAEVHRAYRSTRAYQLPLFVAA